MGDSENDSGDVWCRKRNFGILSYTPHFGSRHLLSGLGTSCFLTTLSAILVAIFTAGVFVEMVLETVCKSIGQLIVR